MEPHLLCDLSVLQRSDDQDLNLARNRDGRGYRRDGLVTSTMDVLLKLGVIYKLVMIIKECFCFAKANTAT